MMARSLGSLLLVMLAAGCAAAPSEEAESADSHLEQAATNVQVPLIDYDGKPLALHNDALTSKGEAAVADSATITNESGHTFGDVEREINASFKRAGLEAPYYYDAGIAMFVTGGANTMCFRGDPHEAATMMVQLRNFEHSVSFGSYDDASQVLVILDDDGFGDTAELHVPRCSK